MADDAPAPQTDIASSQGCGGGSGARGESKIEKTLIEPAAGKPVSAEGKPLPGEKAKSPDSDKTSRGSVTKKGPSYMQQVLQAGDLQDMMLGEFRLLRRLGRGGMAEVYLAEQTSLKRNVALKILRVDLVSDETLIKRFKTEALAAAGLNHPNIVQVYLIGEDRGVEYIVQEYVQGWNLREYITKGPPEVPLAMHILKQAAAALSAAHEAGVVHRDIKPENILLTRKGEVKVADFGLAQLTQQGERLNLTQSGMTMGTPLYMSPEQLSGSKLDARTDIYSLGVTAYHMLTGHPPFQGETALAVALQHMQKAPEPLSDLRADVPDELCHVVHKMLAKAADARFASAQELLRVLKRLQVQVTTGGMTPGEFAAQSLTTPWTGKSSVSAGPKTEPGESAGGATQGGGNISRTGPLPGQASPTATALRAEESRVTEVHEVVPLKRRLTWQECWLRPWEAHWRQQLLPLLVSMLCVATASAGVGWITRPASPWTKPAAPDNPVPRKETAAAQYWYALQQKDEAAWKAVGEFFPQNPLERRRAEQHLALLYVQQQRLQEAQLMFDQLARLPEREAEWRAFGLAGQAIVASLRGEYARSQQILEQLRPLAGQLDRRMRILLSETVLRNQQRGKISIDRHWRELLREPAAIAN